jgi:hypothetical protein
MQSMERQFIDFCKHGKLENAKILASNVNIHAGCDEAFTSSYKASNDVAFGKRRHREVVKWLCTLDTKYFIKYFINNDMVVTDPEIKDIFIKYLDGCENMCDFVEKIKTPVSKPDELNANCEIIDDWQRMKNKGEDKRVREYYHSLYMISERSYFKSYDAYAGYETYYWKKYGRNEMCYPFYRRIIEEILDNEKTKVADRNLIMTSDSNSDNDSDLTPTNDSDLTPTNDSDHKEVNMWLIMTGDSD